MNKDKIIDKYIGYTFDNSPLMYNKEACIGMLQDLEKELEVFPCNICVLDKNYTSDKDEIERLEGIIFKQSDTISQLQGKIKTLQHINDELMGLHNVQKY